MFLFMKKFEYKFNYNQKELSKIIDGFVFNSQNREKDIFYLLVKGYTCEQISNKIGFSETTIKRRRADLFNRINDFLKYDVCVKLDNAKEDDLKDKIKYCVYVLIFPNHKMYIGQTKNTKQRWNNGIGYKENKRMYKDIVKYGWENILKHIAYSNLSYQQSLEKEKELIIQYDTINPRLGYNRDIGKGGKR